jgi:hypothetical protein
VLLGSYYSRPELAILGTSTGHYVVLECLSTTRSAIHETP